MKNKNIGGGGGLTTQTDSKTAPNAKMLNKMQKKYQTLKIFPRSFRSLGILQNSYFWSRLPPCPISICKICCCFFLSSHHDTNPLLHLYHFRKKYTYILANINSESSRVIFSFVLSSSRWSNIFVARQIL